MATRPLRRITVFVYAGTGSVLRLGNRFSPTAHLTRTPTGWVCWTTGFLSIRQRPETYELLSLLQLQSKAATYDKGKQHRAGSGDLASRSAEATARPRDEEAGVWNQLRKLGTLPSKWTMQELKWESKEMSLPWSPAHLHGFLALAFFFSSWERHQTTETARCWFRSLRGAGRELQPSACPSPGRGRFPAWRWRRLYFGKILLWRLVSSPRDSKRPAARSHAQSRDF